MASVKELRAALADYKSSPEGYGHQLRMTLADVVLDGLKAHGWTQRRLAKQSGKDEAYITRVVHGDQNCGLDTIGEILHALGVRASIVPDDRLQRFAISDATISFRPSDTYAREEVQISTAGTGADAQFIRAERKAG